MEIKVYEIKPMTKEEQEAYDAYMLNAESNQRKLVYDLELHKAVIA